MKYTNIKDIIKITDKEMAWFEEMCPSSFADARRPDYEKWMLLYYLAKGKKTCLDIGTGGGYSARAMAYAGCEVDSIDINNDNHQEEKINFIKGKSQDKIPNKKYDLCFIDGDHDYIGVKADLMICKEKCDVIVCHDYNDPNLPGVTKAINEEIDVKETIICDRMWYNAPYEKGFDKNGKKIEYGLVIWRKE